jgi:hypothetical protein
VKRAWIISELGFTRQRNPSYSLDANFNPSLDGLFAAETQSRLDAAKGQFAPPTDLFQFARYQTATVYERPLCRAAVTDEQVSVLGISD